jgi:hypothetical protein
LPLAFSLDSCPISGNLYSKWYFPVMGDSSPLSTTLPDYGILKI